MIWSRRCNRGLSRKVNHRAGPSRYARHRGLTPTKTMRQVHGTLIHVVGVCNATTTNEQECSDFSLCRQRDTNDLAIRGATRRIVENRPRSPEQVGWTKYVNCLVVHGIVWIKFLCVT